MRYSRVKTIIAVFGIPVFIGILLRGIIFREWLASPLRYYHMLLGLDMETVMNMGEMFFNHTGTISLWKLVIALSCALNNGSARPDFIVAVQLVFGVITIFSTAYIALRLTGKRILSAVAGIICALYAPAMMYECFILKETSLLFYVASGTAFVLFCRRNHFRAQHLILCGALLYSITLVRFYGLLWGVFTFLWILAYLFRKYKTQDKDHSVAFRKIFKAFCIMTAGALMAMALTFSANYAWSKTFPEVLIPVEYNMKFGTVDTPSAMHIPAEHELQTGKKSELKDYFSRADVYFKKFTYLFRSFEIPENLNYYFIRDHLFPLDLLLGPGFLIPAAAAGIMMLILGRKFYRKESLLFVYLIAFIIPLCLFFPLGRYRLMFLPVFSIFAAFLFTLLYKASIDFIKGGKMKSLIVPLILYGVFIRLGVSDPLIRATDFLSYGHAIKIQKGNNAPEVELCYRAALSIEPSSETALYSLSKFLTSTLKFKETIELLKPYYESGLREQKIILNYALALQATGASLEAEKVLEDSSGLIDLQSKSGYNYYYCLARVKKALGKNSEAKEAYEKASALIQDAKIKALLKNEFKSILSN